MLDTYDFTLRRWNVEGLLSDLGWFVGPGKQGPRGLVAWGKHQLEHDFTGLAIGNKRAYTLFEVRTFIFYLSYLD